MDINMFISGDMYTLVIIPVLIFVSRIVDVSIGTLRLILVSKGVKKLAPVLGFFEVIIWLLAIRQIMSNLTNVYCYLAYGLGFATGTYVGMLLDEKVCLGKVRISIVTRRDATKLEGALRDDDYMVTSFAGQGRTGRVRLLYLVVKRHDVPKVLDVVKRCNPRAFYSIEDVKFAIDNHAYHSQFSFPVLRQFGFGRKLK